MKRADDELEPYEPSEDDLAYLIARIEEQPLPHVDEPSEDDLAYLIARIEEQPLPHVDELSSEDIARITRECDDALNRILAEIDNDPPRPAASGSNGH
jgi:hypothetical protein